MIPALSIRDALESQSSALQNHTWQWSDYSINYRCYGEQGPPLLLIHGFGASVGHWRKNIPVLGTQYRCYAIDLLGFGQSDKPMPHQEADYTFETWALQIQAFCQTVIGEPTFLIGNSIGCIVALQTAASYPDWVRGVVSLNISLRLLHERHLQNTPFPKRWGVPLVQRLLTQTPLGKLFFQRLAQPKTLRSILTEAYVNEDAVTDELVELLLTPARDSGAADVFLAFISYSQGPLPEDLLPKLSCPAMVLWGEEDPWEPIAQGAALLAPYSNIPFTSLGGVGHCPQDEAPEIVNKKILAWLAQQSAAPMTKSECSSLTSMGIS